MVLVRDFFFLLRNATSAKMATTATIPPTMYKIINVLLELVPVPVPVPVAVAVVVPVEVPVPVEVDVLSPQASIFCATLTLPVIVPLLLNMIS